MRIKDNSAGTRNRLITLAMMCGCIPYKNKPAVREHAHI